MMDGPYYCTKCKRAHTRGKIYEEHAAFARRVVSEHDLERMAYQGTGDGKKVGLVPDDLAPHAIPADIYPTTINPSIPQGVETWRMARESYVWGDNEPVATGHMVMDIDKMQADLAARHLTRPVKDPAKDGSWWARFKARFRRS